MITPVRQVSEASTNSAVSIVNAIPAGKGAAIAVDLRCRVKVSMAKGKSEKPKVIGAEPDPHNLISRSAEYALRSLRTKLPGSTHLEFQIDSEIPTAVGLKSSSALSVAITKAIFNLYSKSDPTTILRSSCRASKDSRASLTGAYDDASASLLGGLVFTDNSKFKLLRHSRAPKKLGSKVAILVPNKKVLTSSIDSREYSRYRAESLEAFRHALNGDLTAAMLINSIIQCAALKYSMEPVSLALGEGANAAGITGKGPAVAAFCDDLKTAVRIKKRWSQIKNSKIILVSVVRGS